MVVREKKHRLPKQFYQGKISVAFTLCLKGDIQEFLEPETVRAFTDILSSAIAKAGCIVPVYCFMPDHQHIIITGTSDDADIIRAIVGYKQRTGYWMAANKPGMRWQKDYYDHVLRTHENIAVQIRYILDNPVRRKIVPSWGEYPFKGSIGCRLEDILHGIV